MKYVLVEPDLSTPGPEFWPHQIHLHCSSLRVPELKRFLNEVVGEGEWQLCRESDKLYHWDFLGKPTRVKFRKKDHAVRMKLMWQECSTDKDLKIKLLPYQQSMITWIMKQRPLPQSGPNSNFPGGAALDYETPLVYDFSAIRGTGKAISK